MYDICAIQALLFDLNRSFRSLPCSVRRLELQGRAVVAVWRVSLPNGWKYTDFPVGSAVACWRGVEKKSHLLDT